MRVRSRFADYEEIPFSRFSSAPRTAAEREEEGEGEGQGWMTVVGGEREKELSEAGLDNEWVELANPRSRKKVEEVVGSDEMGLNGDNMMIAEVDINTKGGWQIISNSTK